MKLAENTSSVVVRIEAPSFKAKHVSWTRRELGRAEGVVLDFTLLSPIPQGPLGLFFMWLAILIVSFSVGANGPPVLSNHGAGQVVNTTTMVNYTETTNGTEVTFNLHPGSAILRSFHMLAMDLRSNPSKPPFIH
jgi:hypothetical protein